MGCRQAVRMIHTFFRIGTVCVPEGGDIDIIAHECVHHWLYMHTGDLDPKHESEFFLTCGWNYMLEGEGD